MTTILIVDDQKNIRNLLKKWLCSLYIYKEHIGKY